MAPISWPGYSGRLCESSSSKEGQMGHLEEEPLPSPAAWTCNHPGKRENTLKRDTPAIWLQKRRIPKELAFPQKAHAGGRDRQKSWCSQTELRQ